MQPARLGAGALCLVSTSLLGLLVLAPPTRAQAVLETPQQTNDRIRELSAAAARSAPHEYIIGNGDLLSIDVFDVKELSRDVRVSQTGTIGIPLVPVRLHIAGLTEIQAEQKISEVLEANGLVSHAEVSITIKERKSKPITVVGAVAHPLVYQADRQVTLLEVLAEAGGLVSDAGNEVIVTRLVPQMSFDESEPPPIGPAEPPLRILSRLDWKQNPWHQPQLHLLRHRVGPRRILPNYLPPMRLRRNRLTEPAHPRVQIRSTLSPLISISSWKLGIPRIISSCRRAMS